MAGLGTRGFVRLAGCALLVGALVACTGPGSSGSATTTSSSIGSRPSSPAVVGIVEPKNGATVTGSTLHVVLSLKDAVIVKQTSTDIRPDQGHVHLYVNNVLVSMNYGLVQDLPVHKGTYVLKAEFVASDHAPFNPRVYSPAVVFTVK
jgi:hypothetical protein